MPSAVGQPRKEGYNDHGSAVVAAFSRLNGGIASETL